MKLKYPFCRLRIYAHKEHLRISLLCMFIICFYGCKKTAEVSSSNSNTAAVSSGSVAITPIGMPTGNAVSKIIGPAGGTLVSADSVVELKIPAGALSSDVNVTIQPVTNEAPGGIGLSYDFLPNGTIFSTPATATFHYLDDSLDGTLPELLWILVQDSSNTWQANPELQDLDTAGKTVSIQIGHFSRRSICKNVKISASAHILHNNDQSTLTVEQTIIGKAEANQTGTVSIGAISYLETVPNQNVTNWQAHEFITNTGAPIGNISGKGSVVTFNAPPQINQEIAVKVTARVGPITEWKGKTKIVVPYVTLSRVLILEPSEFKYSVFFHYRDPAVAGYLGQVYVDSATFDLTITIHPDAPPNAQQNVATAFINNIQNNAPSVTPASETYPKPDGGNFTWTWIPDPIGMFDIQNVTLADSVIYKDSSLIMNFNSDVGRTTGYFGLDQPEDGGVHFTVPSIQVPGGIPASTSGPFIINRKEQEIGDPNQGIYFKITPKAQ
jgi:hypothetical protein